MLLLPSLLLERQKRRVALASLVARRSSLEQTKERRGFSDESFYTFWRAQERVCVIFILGKVAVEQAYTMMVMCCAPKKE
jgi:hypothetical protein